MRRRAMGQETEHGHVITVDGQVKAPEFIGTIFGPALDELGRWGRNGKRIYIDHNSHLECATAECDSPEDVAASVISGDENIRRLTTRAIKLHEEANGSVCEVKLFRNNICQYGQPSTTAAPADYVAPPPSEDTYGTHENYQVMTLNNPGEFVSGLMPYFITRQLLLGAGRLRCHPSNGSRVFEISQRSGFFSDEINIGTTYSKKPIINTRDEPHAVGTKRLHVISGDSNLLPQQTALKFGSMDILLTMLEEGRLKNLGTYNALNSARMISRNPSVRIITNRGYLSALDIQRFYFDQVWQFVTSDSEFDARLQLLGRWGEHLDRLALGYDPQLHVGKLCWATKQVMLERYVERHPQASNSLLQRIELSMHQVTGPGSAMTALIDEYGVYDRQRAHRLQFRPPANTRACVRGAVVKRGHRVETWDIVHINKKKIFLSDPLGNTFPPALLAALKR